MVHNLNHIDQPPDQLPKLEIGRITEGDGKAFYPEVGREAGIVHADLLEAAEVVDVVDEPKLVISAPSTVKVDNQISLQIIGNVDEEVLNSPTFLGKFGSELSRVSDLYLEIVKNPKLIFQGFGEIIKAFFYELPKSLFKSREYEDKNDFLVEKSLQSFGISEMVGFPANYLGIYAAEQLLSAGPVVSTLGAISAHYFACVFSYLASYAVLAKTSSKYGNDIRQSLKEGLGMVKDCFPLATALYAVNGPFMAGLMKIGFSSTVATTVMNVLGAVVFTGVAKVVTNKQLDKALE